MENTKQQFNNYALLGGGIENLEEKQFKLWEKYGKRRIYITREDGKVTYAFIDLDCNNKVVPVGKYDDMQTYFESYRDLFFSIYTI